MPNEKQDAPESNEVQAQNIQTEKKIADSGQKKPAGSNGGDSSEKIA